MAEDQEVLERLRSRCLRGLDWPRTAYIDFRDGKLVLNHVGVNPEEVGDDDSIMRQMCREGTTDGNIDFYCDGCNKPMSSVLMWYTTGNCLGLLYNEGEGCVVNLDAGKREDYCSDCSKVKGAYRWAIFDGEKYPLLQ